MKKDNFMLLNDYFCVKKKLSEIYHFRPIGLQKYLFFYENYHYLNIFKTKPEQNIHQNVPNDTTFNPPKQVHRNTNYFYMKTTIFLDKMNKKIHQNTLIVTSF